MGKKAKKDDKAIPDDVFETVIVESRQAATVVLMISSPEEDVQAKACEALYKFAEKCDANKKIILELGGLDPLLGLITSDDKAVRRNAVMAIGVLCSHSDVRKLLRNRPHAIPSMVALLRPEEDTVIHEYAALALSQMATEFSSKIAIFEAHGVEPLIKLLSSQDPDVQKNAIETIAQLVMDYKTRSAVRMYDGLNSALDLVKSDYAIIQRLALLALDRLTQDGETRRALREIDAVPKLLEILAQPILNDLHVMVVMVLSNLLEDTESLELIKDSGALKQFVSLIMDTQAPEDDSKKKKNRLLGVLRKGVKKVVLVTTGKGRKEDDFREDVPVGADSVIPTLPDVKTCAAKAIARSARNAENRKILHEQEAEKMLIYLLNSESADVQASAALALAVISEDCSSRNAIRQWEGIPPLLKLLRSENGDVKESAALALANLTTGNSPNCIQLSSLGGIETLIACLHEVREEVVASAACALTNLTHDETLRSQAQAQGVVTALIEPLQSHNTNVQSKAALAVAAFACDADSRKEFREAGGLEPLILLLHSGNDEVRRNVAWAITICADEPTAIDICKLGGLFILQEIQTSSSRNSAFTEAALKRLLDSNLSAKFSLYGCLEQGNLIEDGFFDCGKLKQGSPFKSLEEYCAQEMNDKRPIILVNAAVEETDTVESSQADSIDDKEFNKGRRDTTTTKSKTKDSKGKTMESKEETPKLEEEKSKAQREKEEKEKEELAALKKLDKEARKKVAIFTPPADPQLVKYIEDVTDRILPLPTTMAQITALAEYVCEKMGGRIERGQVASFCWELPLSQLRFELKSNVIPVGRIKYGIYIHRALLFKVLADRIALPCSLIRGEYNRGWNEILLPEHQAESAMPKFPPKRYIVDLVHQPGSLLPPDSQAGISYIKDEANVSGKRLWKTFISARESSENIESDSNRDYYNVDTPHWQLKRDRARMGMPRV